MSEQEPPRIVALKQAVEKCLKLGMSPEAVREICKSEIFGAEHLRMAIRDCQAPNKTVRLSYYEQTVDKKIENEEIFAAVNQAVGG